MSKRKSSNNKTDKNTPSPQSFHSGNRGKSVQAGDKKTLHDNFSRQTEHKTSGDRRQRLMAECNNLHFAFRPITPRGGEGGGVKGGGREG